MQDRVVVTLGLVGLGIMNVAREKFGERGLMIAAVSIGLIGVLAFSSDSGFVTLFAGTLCGAVIGLLTRRVLPPAASIAAAIVLSGLGFVVAFMSIFRW